jgi:uncharacterized protein CbrC (UPF0167 family)
MFERFFEKMERGGSPQAYVFECVECGKLCGDFDID